MIHVEHKPRGKLKRGAEKRHAEFVGSYNLHELQDPMNSGAIHYLRGP